MIDLAHRALSGDKARTLLRKLRDLNLTAGPIAVGRGDGVLFLGCQSVDAPAEGGVRYRLRMNDGREGLLEIRADPRGLELELTRGGGVDDGRRLLAEATLDRAGRVCSRSLAARVHPETRDARELEHFLRRIVRGLLRV